MVWGNLNFFNWTRLLMGLIGLSVGLNHVLNPANSLIATWVSGLPTLVYVVLGVVVTVISVKELWAWFSELAVM